MNELDVKFSKISKKASNKRFINATCKVKTGTAYVDGEVVNVETTYNIKAFISKPSYGEIKSGAVSVSDAIILVANDGLEFEPKADNVIDFGFKQYTVKQNLGAYSGYVIPLHRLVGVVR